MGLLIQNVRALSFDLDDTLYDNIPVIKNAFFALYSYLIAPYPGIIDKYSFDAFINSAKALQKEHPFNADLNHLRRLHIQQVLARSGYRLNENSDLIEQAFLVFWRARQQVTLYPDTLRVLEILSAKLPLIAISNGNACIKSIGLDRLFSFSINATATGKPKPDSSMFLVACEKLAIQPEQLIHIGDDLINDIGGAHNAGCRSIWIRPQAASNTKHTANIVIERLSELLDIDFDILN